MTALNNKTIFLTLYFPKYLEEWNRSNWVLLIKYLSIDKSRSGGVFLMIRKRGIFQALLFVCEVEAHVGERTEIFVR